MQGAATDTRSLRQALGRFATGVVVVTGRDPQDGTPVGMTMNSFTSLSLDPPLVLFCIAKSAYSLPAWQRLSHYAVNVLERGQEEISGRFARALARKWDGVRYRPGVFGAPLIEGALAAFECEAHDCREGGDHLIFIGRVLRFEWAAAGEPLLYYCGAYAGLAADSSRRPAADVFPGWPLPQHY